MSDILRVRDIDIVTAEIVTIKRQANQVLITAAIEIGRRLTEAKAMVPFGEWGKYLEERVEYSQSTANNLMKIYKEYGSDQESLFDGFAKSQAFANLNYTQALAMLSIPAEERESFAIENDVANKSTREVQELIRQRDELQAALNASEGKYEETRHKLSCLEMQSEVAEARAVNREKEADELRDQLAKAKAAEDKAKAQLRAARENPVVSDDQMAKIRKEAEETAAAQAAEKAAKETQKLQKKLDAALADAQKAKEEKERALLEADDAKRKADAAKATARLDNPDAAVFKTLWEQVQDTFNRMNGARLKIEQTDPPMAKALATGIKAMLSQWEAQLG